MRPGCWDYRIREFTSLFTMPAEIAYACASTLDDEGGSMNFKPLDIVVLNKDLPSAGLKLGDFGAVIEVYEPDALEVEFVTASGRTEALLTLNVSDVRSVVDTDLVSVRPYSRA
jgi:hypothetical protein